MDEATTSQSKRPNPLCWVGGVVLLVAIFFAGMGLQGALMRPPEDTSEGEVREDSTAFKLINPLLECDLGRQTVGHGAVRPSEEGLRQMISSAKQKGDASFVSIYFRDLNNGPWVGIDERERFTPASLLKLPLMIYYFKLAESDPAILEKRVKVQGPVTLGQEQYFRPPTKLVNDTEYTIKELIDHSVIDSDNTAATALVSIATENPLLDLFQAMHLELPAADQTEDFLTVRDYAAFFRVLFNGSYLTNDSSEKALEILTKSTFRQGLTAQLPADLVVAHKFGERSHSTNDQKQLHDCGIIYYPKNPYLLCIMTRGHDMDKMANVIADISKHVYDEVNGQAKH